MQPKYAIWKKLKTHYKMTLVRFLKNPVLSRILEINYPRKLIPAKIKTTLLVKKMSAKILVNWPKIGHV